MIVSTILALLTPFILIEQAFAINVAINKRVKLCSGEFLPSLLTDGIRNSSRNVAMKTKCWPENYIDIDLVDAYQVKYIQLFEGDPSPNVTGRELDFFEVKYKETFAFRMCSKYQRRSDGPKSVRAMRVNCEVDRVISSKIRIVFTNLEALGFNLAEIEVHSLGSDTLLKRGCVKHFRSEYAFEPVSLEMCKDQCTLDFYRYYAITRGKECKCGNEYNPNHEIASRYCSTKCKDKNEFCGGKDAFSVFIGHFLLPTYVGCKSFEEVNEQAAISGSRIFYARDMSTMTIPICFRLCDNYRHLLIKNGTTCYCTSMHYLYFSYPELCNVTCGGDSNSMCGGLDHVSIYSTCIKDNNPSTRCSFLIHCKREMDETGACPYGCEHGWQGMSCMERDLEVDVQSDCVMEMPCLGLANTECRMNDFLYECACIKGFKKTADESCTDIDECEEQKCDSLTSSCINLIGTYYCECKPNTYSLSNFSCIGNVTPERGYFLTILLFVLPILSAALTAVLFTTIPSLIQITLPLPSATVPSKPVNPKK